MTDDFDDPAGRPSKSARKREHQTLQRLAEDLISLPAPRFRKLPLGERARDEFERARGMAPGGSLNRQVRLLAQLLLEEDVEALRAVPGELARRHGAETAMHHAAEKLREDLLARGLAALEAYAPATGDLARARVLLNDATALSDGVRARTAHRELYRFARELLARGD